MQWRRVVGVRQYRECAREVLVRSRDVRDALADVGGVPLALFAVGAARTRAGEAAALRLLLALLRGSAANGAAMEAYRGHQVVGRLLQKRRWAPDAALLDTLFAFVGVARSPLAPAPDAYDTGLVASLPALRHLVLDWCVWSHAPRAVQRRLLRGLRSLATAHSQAAFNVRRLAAAGAVPELLHVLQSPRTRAPDLVRDVIALIRAILDGTGVKKSDMRAIADFLFATYRPPQSFRYTVPGTPQRVSSSTSSSSSSLSSSSSGLYGTPSTPENRRRHPGTAAAPSPLSSPALLRQSAPAGSNMGSNARHTTPVPLTRRMPPLSPTPPAPIDPGASPEGEQAEMTQKRALVLDMVLQILLKAPPATQEDFVTIFPIEAILAMM